MFKGDLLYNIFRFILAFCVCTRTCLHALMFKKLFSFLILPMAAALVFTSVSDAVLEHLSL